MHNTSSWGKVAIGVRYTRGEPLFFLSWTGLLCAGLHPDDILLTPAIHLPHAYACNFIVKEFLDTDADSLLFVDDDMGFPPDTLSRMRSCGEEFDAMQALYVCRRPPFLPVCLINGEFVESPSGLVEVTSVGLGFTLVKRWVLESLPDEPFVFSPALGEDGQFSADARAVGARLAVNADVTLEHVVPMAASWDSTGKKACVHAKSWGLVIDRKIKEN